MFSQEEFWRALRADGKLLEVKGIAEAKECKADEAKMVTSVVFMMKRNYSYIRESLVEKLDENDWERMNGILSL